MLYFGSDYQEGGCEAVMRALLDTNLEHVGGYGEDPFCDAAKEKIKKACACPSAQIGFFTGGTQTNMIAIDALLKPYEGVIAAQMAHISLHEAGAIEATGHKVIELPAKEGKLDASTVRSYIEGYFADPFHEHIVRPGMVYITYPTEYGTLYSKKELREIRAVCEEYKIPLYLDGARLGYGLASDACDLTLADIAEICDAFYIGGSKVGALMGEALVFTKNNMPEHFLPLIKRRGALCAKGRVLGVQFAALMDVYYDISRHAIDMAKIIRAELLKKGYELYVDSPTNQIFPIVTKDFMESLEGRVGYGFWEWLPDGRAVIRFATNWATREDDVRALCEIL
ncbi:MAG: low specificity L-threonine aldolase [Clostridia bacterium]|nr:low specificity L-threonine aldolase [Clostridia bacterium]